MPVEFLDDGFGSFGGLVFENIFINEADVIVVGIPFDSAASGRKGASFGPAYLRLISKDMQTMSRSGIDLNDMALKDLGNVPVYPLDDEKTRESIEEAYDFIFNATDNPVITFGGDHSVTFPILKSLAKMGRVGIVWFDAHRDLLDSLIGSKYSHGSPLRRALELNNISAKNVLLVGTRYMEPEEQVFLENNKIEELRMVDLEASKFSSEVFLKKVKQISKDIDYLYVSIDIDVLDPGFAPGTGTPVGGGMTTTQLMRMINELPIKVRAFDIMEVSPEKDHANITLKASMGLFSEILGTIHQLKD